MLVRSFPGRLCYAHDPDGTSHTPIPTGGHDARMDNSLTLARHFARLVWLLIHEGPSTAEQKGALRAMVFVSKEASVRLGNSEGRLTVNGLVMPQALAGVQELAERLASHAIEAIDLEQSAAPSELLALARLLAVPAASTSDAAAFAQRLVELQVKTVHVRFVPTAAAATGVPAVEKHEPPTKNERASELWDRLAAAKDVTSAQQVLDELAFVAEQATREGRTADVADKFITLIEYEAKVDDPEIRRLFALSARRLTKPTILQPLARLIVTDPPREAQTERILQRCAQDGVDAVVDQFLGARSIQERRAYRDVLFRLDAARASLIQMLSDPRWYVVRQAAEFLGESASLDVERPLADLLRHQDERVRRAAARALSRIDSAFALDALGRALADPATTVRLEAVTALGARKVGRAGALLASAIDVEGDQEVQMSIVAALGRLATPESVAKLAAVAAAAGGFFKSKKNSALRLAAIAALGNAHTPAALSALQGQANDREKEVRDAVALALASQRGTAA